MARTLYVRVLLNRGCFNQLWERLSTRPSGRFKRNGLLFRVNTGSTGCTFFGTLPRSPQKPALALALLERARVSRNRFKKSFQEMLEEAQMLGERHSPFRACCSKDFTFLRQMSFLKEYVFLFERSSPFRITTYF